LSITLFDDVARTDLGPALRGEPQFTYLNRTARPRFAPVRDVAEAHFGRYPVARQPSLRERFRSAKDSEHYSAAFELILHELLLRLGCGLEIEPELRGGKSRHPDFLVHAPDGADFYLEATVVSGKTREEAAAEARINTVYDTIDHMDSPNFFITFEMRGVPRTPVPGKDIRAHLAKELSALDPDAVIAEYERRGDAALPKWPFLHDGWHLTFSPIPKSPTARGKPGVRPIGISFTGMHWVQTDTHIRSSIMGKAGRYGDLKLPYVVAVNVLDHIDTEDVMTALFGDDVVRFDGQTATSDRERNGVWTGKGGPRYTRLSAVLVASSLRSDTLCSSEAAVSLWLNPWAVQLYDSVLTRLPRHVAIDGRMTRLDGVSVGGILGLPADWPGGDSPGASSP